MTQLIIAEKPAAAAKLAYALGTFKQVKVGRTYYFEGKIADKPAYIASAVGHLFFLKAKEKYNIIKDLSYEREAGAIQLEYFFVKDKFGDSD